MDICKKIRDHITQSGIDELVNNASGITVAYSGGADSSLLLHYLVSQYGCEKVSACHVNHMIRGDEADRDQEFCRRTCEKYNVQFFSAKINIPQIAKQEGLGTEEAARRERYAFLEKCAEGKLIATAHNATDNLETVIFNLSRGSGLKGLGGIAPVRGNIIRPLLCLTGEEIRNACEMLSIPFVTDSTNLTCDYTRNFIRHEIVPKLRQLNPSADAAALRGSRIARDSFEYIEQEGQKLIESENFIYREALINAKKTVAISALHTLFKNIAGTADGLGEIHLEDAYRFAVEEKKGQLSMPHKIKFIAAKDRLYFGNAEEKEYTDASFHLPIDGNVYTFGEHFAVCAVKRGTSISYDENIYNLFIKHSISFDTIEGSIFVRCRQPGDKLLCGGIHKKLKKLMCEKNVPEAIRDSLPIFCDKKGILLVPGVSARYSTAGHDINFYVLRRKGNLYNA